MVVVDDLEVFTFIESVIDGFPFSQGRDHLSLRLVEQVSVRCGWLCSKGQIGAQESFLLHVLVIYDVNSGHE
jgi:hypothetical protein